MLWPGERESSFLRNALRAGWRPFPLVVLAAAASSRASWSVRGGENELRCFAAGWRFSSLSGPLPVRLGLMNLGRCFRRHVSAAGERRPVGGVSSFTGCGRPAACSCAAVCEPACLTVRCGVCRRVLLLLLRERSSMPACLAVPFGIVLRRGFLRRWVADGPGTLRHCPGDDYPGAR